LFKALTLQAGPGTLTHHPLFIIAACIKVIVQQVYKDKVTTASINNWHLYTISGRHFTNDLRGASASVCNSWRSCS